MTLRTAVAASRSGVDFSAASAAASAETFATTGQEVLWVKNGSGSDITVTVTIQQAVDGVTPTPVAHTVTAGHEMLFGPYDAGRYQSASDGLVHVAYSAVTTVTALLLKVVPLGS